MKNIWKIFKREEKRKAHTSACHFCFPLLVTDIVYIKDFDMKS